MEDKNISEKESLQIISEMIQKAKPNFHSNGISAILWGTTIAICGLLSFAQRYWNFRIGFDIWYLTIVALIPQVIMTIRNSRSRRVITYIESSLNAIWTVYVISIFALVFYLNVAGVVSHYNALFLLIYAIPTFATGLLCNYKPMIFGAILCYLFFVLACYSSLTYGLLLNGLAGIFNWLIPGIILRSKMSQKKGEFNV